MDLGDFLQNDVMPRLVALEQLMITNLAGAVPYFFYTQETFPYFTNRLGRITPIPDPRSELQQFSVEVIPRLVIGHVTAGYDGVLQNEGVQMTGDVLMFVTTRPLLYDTGAAAPADEPIRYMQPNTGAVISAGRISTFPVPAAVQWATDFSIQFTLVIDVEV